MPRSRRVCYSVSQRRHPSVVQAPGACLFQRGSAPHCTGLASLTSTVGGFVLGGSMPTVAPRSFLDCYSEAPPPSQSDSLFAMVLPSHVTLVLPVQRGSTPAPAPMHHGGPPSRPNPVSVNVASSAPPRCSVLGGIASTTANARSTSILPQLPAGGTSPTIMGGSSVPPPQQLWLLPSWPWQPSCASWGASICPTFSVHAWGASCSSLGCTLVCVLWCTLSPGPWGVSLCGYIGCPEPGVCGLIASSFFAAG
jgi:hypothetical protein